MKIGPIDLDQEVLFVAEIGNNHEGDFGLAREMIHAAAAAGAQAVKFQTIVPARLVAAPQAARLEQLERFAFTREQFAELASIANAAGVMFLSTPFAPEVVPWLDELVPAFKIASGDNNFSPLLRAVGARGKPVLLSTGMADLPAIDAACKTIEAASPDPAHPGEIVLLHCVSAYPTPPEQANLGAIKTLAMSGRTPGYSDHTLGVEASVLAVALGARIIEKHFTLSKTQSGFRDHALSADPAELTALIARARQAVVLLGGGGKAPQAAEAATAAAARRSIVAREPLNAGHRIGIEDLDWLRPGHGLPPGQEDQLVGRRLRCAVGKGEAILPGQVD